MLCTCVGQKGVNLPACAAVSFSLIVKPCTARGCAAQIYCSSRKWRVRGESGGRTQMYIIDCTPVHTGTMQSTCTEIAKRPAPAYKAVSESTTSNAPINCSRERQQKDRMASETRAPTRYRYDEEQRERELHEMGKIISLVLARMHTWQKPAPPRPALPRPVLRCAPQKNRRRRCHPCRACP